MKKLTFVVVIWLGALTNYAQINNQNAGVSHKVSVASDTLPKPHNLQLIGRSYGDSVVLRWAPSKSSLWYFANKSGYQLVRYEVENKRILANTRKVLTPSPLKPWTLDEWKRKAQRNDSMAAVAAQLLYGKSKATDNHGKKGSDTNLQEALNQNYELEDQHSMALFLADQSPVLATGLGLRFADKFINRGKSYAYAVFATTDPKIVKSDTSGVFVNTTEIVLPPEMPAITIEESDRKVKLSWSRVMAGMYFTSYYYERSEDGGKTFKRINKRPFVQLTTEQKPDLASVIEINDSLPKNYKQYIYRVAGITPFGDLGKWSPDLPAMGRDKTPPSPPDHIAVKNIKGNQVKISWMKKTKEPDFTGFLIGRSDKASGPFLPLTLQPVAGFINEFTDTMAYPHGTNYYIVSAMDTAGNAAASLPAYAIMTDTIPPAKPVGLTGKIDTTGIIQLKWNLGKEEDLMGYLIYSANDLKHTFVPISKDFLADSTFSDSITLKTLTSKIYYKVVAFDKNRNPSAYSDPLELIKPDKVAPVTPVFTSFHVTDTTVMMNWVNSSSSDVVSQILYRREKGKVWEPHAKLETTANAYIDRQIQKHSWYEYCLEAIDNSGLHSPKSFPLRVRTFDSGQRSPIQNFTVVKSPDGKSLVLSWNYSVNEDCWFVISKSVDGKGFMTFKNLPANQHTYTDPNLKRSTYQYSVKVVFKDGGESQAVMSEKIEYIPSGK